MHDRNDDNFVALRPNFIHDNIWQARDDPFKSPLVSPGMTHLRKCREMFRADENPLDDSPRHRRIIFRDPIVDAFEIDERVLVENEFHAPNRLMRARASS